jgi:hypothetical protein
MGYHVGHKMTASKSIRLKCLDCSGESPKEVTLCHITDCALWPRRMGTSAVATKRFKDMKERSPEDYKIALSVADNPEVFKKGL